MSGVGKEVVGARRDAKKGRIIIKEENKLIFSFNHFPHNNNNTILCKICFNVSFKQIMFQEKHIKFIFG
jgi:hypothetical protein